MPLSSYTLMTRVKEEHLQSILFSQDMYVEGIPHHYPVNNGSNHHQAHIIKRDPKEESMVKMERYRTGELKPSSRTVRTGIEHSRIAKAVLKSASVLGVSLTMSDGVLTPAQSVLGAVQGLRVVRPGISTSTIIGVSCAILILLFLIQPLGTSKIASTFAPIVMVWLLFNAVFGIYNLALFDHSVLKAFSPYFAGAYLVRNRTDGWKSLGGILLAFTGNLSNRNS